MKKVYIAPEMEVIKVDAINMLAASGDEGSLKTGGTIDGADGALGREDNGPSAPGVWDSEW